jgi:4-alpha-glucanotransferase
VKEASVRALARRAGLDSDWTDAAGRPQRVALEALVRILGALGFPCSTTAEGRESRDRLLARECSARPPPLVTAASGRVFRMPLAGIVGDVAAELVQEDGVCRSLTLRRQGTSLVGPGIAAPGYHRLRFADREVQLAVAPRRCLSIADVAGGRRRWGLAVQLYSLAREGDGGIGDTTALRGLLSSAARHGADAVALSPVHSLFAANGRHISPYAPSNRLFLNPLYADPSDALPGVCLLRRPDLERMELIDWPTAARAKYAAIRETFDRLKDNPPSALAEFIAQGGARLREHALFEAVHAHWMDPARCQADWRRWPQEWRGPATPAVAAFAAASPREVLYHQFLQWLATVSFTRAQASAHAAGMSIGLIADLAIGVDPAGSHAWTRPTDLLTGLSVGAPPDIYIPSGQDWGLVAISPMALVDAGFEPFIATVRAALRHAGGLRIDHAMGLLHLWLVPHGALAAEGAYLNYPLDDMLRLLALESHRHHAVVVGEDLGTVPPEFRARLREAGVAGMDVLWFQRDGERFQRPAQWRPDAMAMTTTHDLPTVAGWWSGSDIAERARLGIVGGEDASARSASRAMLWRAFVEEGVASADPLKTGDAGAAVNGALGFVARSPSPLMVVPAEDLLARTAQPNLPGTVDEHPNWRRRLPVKADEMLDDPAVAARVAHIRKERA